MSVCWHPHSYELSIKKLSGWNKHCKTVDTVALGGSRCDYGINPDYFDKTTYNFGLTSLDAFGAYHLLKKIHKSAPNLKNVVFVYSVHLPGYKLWKCSEKFRCAYYKMAFGIPYPYVGRTRKIKAKIRSHKTVSVPDDFLGYYNPESAIDNDIVNRTRGHLKHMLRDKSQLKYLRKMARLCRRRGYNLIVIISPARSDYCNLIHPYFIELSLQYIQHYMGLAGINMFADSAFTDDDFCDSDHLNAKGAIKLSKKINNIIKEISHD